MKIQHFIIIGMITIISCGKSPKELFDSSEANLKNNNMDLAINDLRSLLEKHPNDSLAPHAQYKIFSIYLNNDQPDSAAKDLQNLLENYPNYSHVPFSLYEISSVHLKNNKVDLAIKDLQNLLEKYPSDSLIPQAQYKLSTIYLNYKNDMKLGYDALKNTVKNHAGSIQGNQAQDELNQFPEYIINKAESLRKRKMLKEAINALMFMTDNFKAEKSSSKAQYMKGDIYMNDIRDFDVAIQEYRKVINNYSGSEQEPHALFMIGYIYANIINDSSSAKVEYQKFLNTFPNHELAPSVKFEIEYLGKSIEDIPALKHITS
tara:strand:- start:818 stop:1771 length:954 start_codon:yes stop_codon:yes gene_type:complete